MLTLGRLAIDRYDDSTGSVICEALPHVAEGYGISSQEARDLIRGPVRKSNYAVRAAVGDNIASTGKTERNTCIAN